MVLRLFRLKKTPQPAMPPGSSAGPDGIPPTAPSPADPGQALPAAKRRKPSPPKATKAKPAKPKAKAAKPTKGGKKKR